MHTTKAVKYGHLETMTSQLAIVPLYCSLTRGLKVFVFYHNANGIKRETSLCFLIPALCIYGTSVDGSTVVYVHN